jgi:hemerythrin superfamily protein
MNAITLLKTDHGNVEALFKQFDALGHDGDPAEKRRVVDHIIEQLSVHASIEEQLLYPALRAALDDDFPILEALEEHHVAKATLAEIEKLVPTHERFDAKVTVLIESVRHHVEEEERDLFEMMRVHLSATELEDLGTAMDEAKKTAPTRPHPLTPDQPPLQTLIAMPVAVLDRIITEGRKTVMDVLEQVANRGKKAA